MTLLWAEPRVWETNEPITEEKLNEISDSLTYLYTPTLAVATVRAGGASPTFTNTSFAAIDDATYLLTLEIRGDRQLTVELEGTVSNTTVASVTFLDVLIDGVTYVSSLTGTAIVTGLWVQEQPVAAHRMHVRVNARIPAGVLAAGVHTFSPRIRVSANTTTWYTANHYSQFQVGEY